MPPFPFPVARRRIWVQRRLTRRAHCILPIVLLAPSPFSRGPYPSPSGPPVEAHFPLPGHLHPHPQRQVVDSTFLHTRRLLSLFLFSSSKPICSTPTPPLFFFNFLLHPPPPVQPAVRRTRGGAPAFLFFLPANLLPRSQFPHESSFPRHLRASRGHIPCPAPRLPGPLTFPKKPAQTTATADALLLPFFFSDITRLFP